MINKKTIIISSISIFFIILGFFLYNKYMEKTKYYFPKYAFIDDILYEYYNNIYNELFNILDNEKLYLIRNNNVIRFSYLNDRIDSISIKIKWNKNNVKNGKLKFNMINVNKNENIKYLKKEISNYEISKIIDMINEYDIYNNIESEKFVDIGWGGAYWIIEVNINGKYILLNRWSPESGVVYDIGNHMLNLSGKNIKLW
jgi:hypothetical protein